MLFTLLGVMSIQTNAEAEVSEKPMSWATFLESQPPAKERKVTGMVTSDYQGGYVLGATAIQIYCDSKYCGGVRFFDCSTSNARVSDKHWISHFLDYSCRHCK